MESPQFQFSVIFFQIFSIIINMKLIVLFILIGIVASQSCFNCVSQCSQGGRCLGCDVGYNLDNIGSCGRYTPIEDCKIYDVTTGGCYECFPGNLLQYGICQQLIQNCNYTSTNNTEICTACNETYTLVDDIHCYSANTNACPLGSLPRSLQTTKQGFCQKFQLQRCSVASDDVSYCKACMSGYSFFNGVCNNLTNKISCPSNSCQCQYYYNNDNCYQFQLEGCLNSKDKLYCDLCNDTLVAVSGRCFQPVKISDIHCNVLQLNRDICTGCNFRYLLDPNSICVKSINFCDDPKKTCQSQCTHPNLLFYNGQCFIKDPQCISYDQINNKCIKCFQGYSLNQNNKCDKKQKCWVYTNNGKTCQKCFSGFQLNQNTLVCDRLPNNCKFVNNGGVCMTCSNFTQLINQQIASSQIFPSNLSIVVNSSVCVYTTLNCQYYNIYGFCQICKPSFIQKKHQCIPVATNCQIPLDIDKSKCQICSVGYELDTISLTCYPRIEGCLQYTSTKQCGKCNQGFVLRNGVCFYKDPNCLQYTSKGFCLRCSSGLVPYYNQCVYYDPYCYLYDRNGVCTMAHAGFSKSSQFNTNLQTNYRSFIAYVRNIQASAAASSSNAAGSSQFSQISIYGGYYTSQGWVRVLPSVGLYNQRILQYDLNGKIRYCREGYTLNNGNCVLKIDYCSDYSSSNGLCVRCNVFYHMGVGRKCVSTSTLICSIPTSTGEYCSKCSSDYTLVNGQCFYTKLNFIDISGSSSGSDSGSGSSGSSSSSNSSTGPLSSTSSGSSSTSSSSSSSLTVQNGYFIWQKYQIAYPYDSNCVNQNQPGKCAQCLQQSQFTQSGMRNIDGKCVLIQDNCARYSQRGLCEVCSAGYFLAYGRCYANNCLSVSASDGVCATCPFLFTYQAGICVNKVQNNCLVYDQIINYNTTIRSVSCRYCVAGYYLKNDGSCQRMVTNCDVTDSQTGRCTACITSYFVYQDQCIRQIIGCQIYNRSTTYTTCTSCIANYNLTNNLCYTLPFRCNELNSTGQCSKCSTGYNPIIQAGQSICIFTVSNCITYSKQGRCTVCARNFVLQNNLCNFYVPGCQDLANGTCIRCLPGYFLRNGYCIIDPNCILVDFGVCTKCIDGFRLFNGICIKNSIDDCILQRDEDCLECRSGYVKVTLYGKVYCVLRTIIYSGCSVEQYPCPKCQPGFQLRDDGLCYAQRCLYQLSRFSLRTCTACYPYYKLDPTKRFCLLYNCNSPGCYGSNQIPSGFTSTNITGFIIYIKYCTSLEDDYSCHSCSNYRYPNLLVQWNLCYPSNCRLNQLFDCTGNCYAYFGNNVVDDKTVCTADNCQVYNSDGTCVTCVKPYNVTNGICLYLGPCSDYNPVSNQCKACRDAYNLISGSCIPKNCTAYSPVDVSVCLECARGYQLTVNKTCQLKYCIYPNQNYPCVQCRAGFYFNSLTSLCQMSYCRIFDYVSSSCQQCETSYIIHTSGFCIPDQCSSFDQSTLKCLACVQGYKLNSNGLCVINNCCSFNGLVCAQCCSGYDYVQGLCRSRCQQFNAQGICITCRPGYKLNSNGECVTEVVGCVAYSGSRCIQCQAGLLLNNGVCIPKYCASYSEVNSIVCITCLPRFYKLSSGLCYPKNCLSFNSSEWVCQQCEYGLTYKFSLIQKQGLCFTDHCSVYQLTDYVCKQCQTSALAQYQLQTINSSQICSLQCGLYYQLVNGDCKLKYCSTYYPNGKCSQCASGYELQVSTGYCKLKYCLNYNQQNCQNCLAGYMLDPVNNRYCVPAYCQNYVVGSDICQKCQQGYVRQYNLCILKYCYIFNSQYVCQKCIEGFTLTQVGGDLICQRNFNSTCNDGYYFSSTRGSCQPIPVDYCSYTNPANPTLCLSCFPGYYLWNGICYSLDGCQPYLFSYISGCKQCIAGFKLNGNLCIKDLCDQYYANATTCKYCVQGYYLVNGQCISYQDFCINGNVNQGCITCQNGYQSINGVCKKLPDNCVSLNPSLTCIQCIPKYFLYQGICYQSIPNCLVQNGPFCTRCDNLFVPSTDQRACISKQPIRYCQQHDSTFQFCLICQDGFKLTEDRKCLAEHCSKYDLSTNICIQCANQTINGVSYFYALKDQKCYSITINYCSVPLDQNKCRVCIQGYINSNGICIAQNCQIFKSNQQQCNTCINGYYLTSNSICKRYPDFCQVVNSNGACTVCLAGYTLNAQNICVKSTDFCQQYNTAGVCVNCQKGYYLTSGNICARLPDNCLIANIFGVCLRCVDPFILSGSGVCYKVIINCGSYNDLGSCIACNNGYYLTDQGSCQILPDNCIIATATGVCRQCASGFRLENGICIRSVDNCGTYKNNICTSCSNGYYLINGLCYKLPDRCSIVNQNSECLQCLTGYVLYRGFCYSIIPNCLAYSPLGECNQCDAGYYINSIGKCSNIPNNCNKVNFNGICLECLSGFILGNGICYKEVSNCFAYNPTNNLCLQCISGYFLIQGKCYRLPQNCLTVNTFEVCLSCINGYTLQNGICYLNLPNCQIYSSNGVCARCVSGFYLSVNGTCSSIPEGCSQVASNNPSCTSCTSGYVLQEGICYKEYPNCFIYNQTSRQCRQCIDGFYLLNGFCYQLPSNCLTVDSQKQCTACINGYILQNGICYRQIDFCIAYSGSVCIQCQGGYYVNSQGVCSLNPTNCNQTAANGTCLKCVDGYFLQQGVCYKFDTNCIAYNPVNFLCRVCADGYYLSYQYLCVLLPKNCINANIYGNCTTCRTNYSLSNSICYPTIPQCDSFDQSTFLCLRCISGYFLKDGYCFKTVQNCQVYSPQNYNCVKCMDTFILSNNLCITCGAGYYVDNYGQCRNNPDNCKVSNQFGQCIQCQSGYTSLNGLCTQQILYCQNYTVNSNRNICIQCFVGYYLKDPFTCLRLPNGCAAANNSGFCLQCYEGYTLNTNGICYTLIQFCQSYQLSTGICLQCIPNYYLNVNQTCTPILSDNCLFANSLGQCIQCVQNYVLVNSVCYIAIPYCFNHSTSSYSCLQCVQGYYLFNRTCSKMPNGCINVNNAGICLACAQGYQLSNGLCMFIDDSTCIKYQLLTSLCLQCKAGFYLAANNLCVKLPDYCQQCNSQGICISCISGYTLNNGICFKEIPNCLRWGTSTCLQCIDQFYLQNGLCYRYPDYCQTFDQFTLSCLKCISGYQLSFGRCIINQSTNCLYYNPNFGNQCFTCKNSFYQYWLNPSTGEVITSVATIDNFCRSYPQFCTNVDLFGNCISCCFASRLENGKCVPTNQRSLNCDIFDSVNMKCLKCMVGYFYCEWTAICIQINLNCLSYNSLNQCTNCVDGFNLVNYDCVRQAPGMSLTNSGVCNSGYSYLSSSEYGSGCFRNKNQLRKISTQSNAQYYATSSRPSSSYNSQRFTSTIWNPPAYLNNYISILSSSPQIIHYIQIQGTSSGYVTYYVIHYRNKDNAPFICWNSCQKVRGSLNGNDFAQLKLSHPIVATEVRIYPVQWVGGIWMSLQMLVQNQ